MCKFVINSHCGQVKQKCLHQLVDVGVNEGTEHLLSLLQCVVALSENTFYAKIQEA